MGTKTNYDPTKGSVAVIFDLDGTLADTLDDLTDAMNKMLVSFGWQKRTRDEMMSFINCGARRFVAQSMPDGVYGSEDDRLVDVALEIYSRKYAEAYCEKTAPFGDMADQLKRLKAAGFKLAVLSNKQDSFVKVITEKLFPNTFDMACGHLSYPHKPDPTAALAIASELGADPSSCIFVGDSDVDMMTAGNAGMYPIGVLWGYRGIDTLTAAGAKAFVSSPRALADKILSLGK